VAAWRQQYECIRGAGMLVLRRVHLDSWGHYLDSYPKATGYLVASHFHSYSYSLDRRSYVTHTPQAGSDRHQVPARK
jgi:hypothetical protein